MFSQYRLITTVLAAATPVMLSIFTARYLIDEHTAQETAIESLHREPICAELPIGGAARLLVHDSNYNTYLEQDLTYVSEHIVEDEPIEEWVQKHLKQVRGTFLNARSSADNSDDSNIRCILMPYEEIMVVGKYGEDWLIIEYDDEILYVMSEYVTEVEKLEPSYDGAKLSSARGRIQGPNGSETYYNLDMSGIVARLKRNGYEGEYWIREDGCKMFGDYIMVAANFDLHPYGSIVETSLGLAIVCDTGGFVKWNPTGIDIATNW